MNAAEGTEILLGCAATTAWAQWQQWLLCVCQLCFDEEVFFAQEFLSYAFCSLRQTDGKTNLQENHSTQPLCSWGQGAVCTLQINYPGAFFSVHWVA